MADVEIETMGVGEWIYTTLAADGTIRAALGTADPRIYEDIAPQGTVPPYIIYSYESGADELTVNARGAAVMTYAVRAVVRSPYFTDAAPLARRINALLDHAAGSATLYPVIVNACVRIEPFRLAERTEGIDYRHLGGRFRIIAS